MYTPTPIRLGSEVAWEPACPYTFLCDWAWDGMGTNMLISPPHINGLEMAWAQPNHIPYMYGQAQKLHRGQHAQITLYISSLRNVMGSASF